MNEPLREAPEFAGSDREAQARPVALVTGASSGIGKAFAERLAYEGFDLVLVARDEASLTELADRLRKTAGCAVEVLPADLADPAQCARVERRLGSSDRVVELLVNCAGHALRKPFVATSVEDEQRLLDVHVRAVLRLTKAAVDTMCARRRGAAINVGSVAAWAPRGSYSAHKAWVVAFSEAVGAQTADRGVHVMALCPGYVHTELEQRAGMRTNRPGFAVLDPDRLVADAIRDLKRGRRVSVPTTRYAVFAAVLRHLPHRWTIPIKRWPPSAQPLPSSRARPGP
jgi:short-subunit dehydrogenase